jgi:hypothetical protein
MAIGPDQKVTTTGLMDNKPTMPNAPDLSALGKGQQQSAPQKVEPMVKKPEPEQPNVNDRIDQVGQANPESIAQVDLMLSDPDINDIMQKLAPEAAGKIAQFKGEEKIVALPTSVVKSYAMRMYGGDEQSSVQQFLTDLSGEQPDDTNVPPDMATQTDGMMSNQNANQEITPEMDAIDQGQEELA